MAVVVQDTFSWDGNPTSYGHYYWTLDAGTQAGWWLLAFHGWDRGNLSDMVAPDKTPGTWQLLAAVDAGIGLPKWKVWALKLPVGGASQVGFQGPPDGDNISYLYVLSGLRPYDDPERLFCVGAAASAAPSASQTVPYYAPDDSGLLVGVWLTGGGVVNYTMPGSMTPQVEGDGSASSVQAGQESVTSHGLGNRTATTSAAGPWAAVSVVCRDFVSSVTFPNQQLGIRMEIAPGASPDADPATWAGLWTDITSDVYARQPITITRGRADEASTVGPSSMSLELNNAGGKYTRLNPLSPFYGKLNKNTPVRLWVNPGSGWDLRYAGSVAEWPPRQQGGGVNQHMPVEASGVTRRMAQRRSLRSPLVRAINNTSVLTYWPLESDAASGLVGGSPMHGAGEMTFSSGGGPAGSAGSTSFGNDGKLYGAVPGMPNSGSWTVAFYVDIPANFDVSADQSVLVDWQTPGMANSRWLAYVAPGTGGKMVVASYLIDNTVTSGIGVTDLRGIGPTLIYIQTRQFDPSTVIAHLYVGNQGFVDASTTLTDTISPITSIDVNGYLGTTDPIKGSISHLMVFPYGASQPISEVTSGVYPAGSGYAGEQATDRIARLSAEENIPVIVLGDDGTSEQMGPQPTDKFLTILRDCEDADGGVLYERRDGRLAYATRAGRYNQTPALTLNYASAHVAPPLEPTDDDQRLRNDVEVSRTGGSSARATDPDSIATVGLYGESASINVYSDDVLDDHAGWRVHLGTNDDLRYPAVAPNINGQASAVIPGWLGLDVGKAVAITNPAADLAAGTVRLLGEGYTEAIDTVSWTATLNCSPGAPWRTAILDDTTLGRLDTDGSVLANAATSSATSLTIATTDGPAWTTSAGDMPFDITVGGEQVTVTAAAPYLTDAFGRTTSNGWGNADTGQAWSTAGPASATNYSVSGGFGRHSLAVVNQHMFTVAPSPSTYFDITADLATDKTATGADIILYLVGRFADTSNYYMANVGLTTSQAVVLTIRRNVAGTETHLGGGSTGLVHTANARVAVRFQGMGSQLRAKIWPVAESEPIDWQVTVTDTSLTAAGSVGFRSLLTGGNTNTLPVVATYDSVTVIPQTLTVTRSVNGVVKSHSVGEDVRLATPPILAL